MGIQEKIVREINKHNRAFIAEVNRKVGVDWTLTYSNKVKCLWPGRHFREYELELRHVDYGVRRFMLHGMDVEPKLSRENLKERIDSFCRLCPEPGYKIFHELKEQYDKFYDIEMLVENLNQSLEENNELSKSKRLKI
jgi:hypothetical protein